jgi:hypothetical protein
MLRLTVSRAVNLGIKHPSGVKDHILLLSVVGLTRLHVLGMDHVQNTASIHSSVVAYLLVAEETCLFGCYLAADNF